MRFHDRFEDLFVHGDEDRHRHLSSTSATQHQPQPHRPNIIPPDDEDLIDCRLLLDLAEMEGTIDRNPYAYTREEKVMSIMCRELKTIGY
jgi:hypothetical protein